MFFFLINKGAIMSTKPYGLMKFLGDIFATIFTGGFWLIWIFVREMRK
jgi:hypothetical protein